MNNENLRLNKENIENGNEHILYSELKKIREIEENEIQEKSNYLTDNSNQKLYWNDLKFQIENPIRIFIENNLNMKLPVIQVDTFGFTLEDYVKENNELKKINEILEREINLLKSLILINNLNLNTSDFKPCKFYS